MRDYLLKKYTVTIYKFTQLECNVKFLVRGSGNKCFIRAAACTVHTVCVYAHSLSLSLSDVCQHFCHLQLINVVRR
jgi:hypothetical protein